MKPVITPSESIKRKIDARGFTNFIESAKTQLKLVVPGTTDHGILEFLIKHAVGAKNAKTWEQIKKHLSDLGFKITKNMFQTGLLRKSRKDTYFIGSGHKGFFIMKDQSDVKTALKFYDTRIEQETANRDALRLLGGKADFACAGSGKDAAA